MNDIEDYRLILESIEAILNNNETDTTKVDVLKEILKFYRELDILEEPIGKEFTYIWNRNIKRKYERNHRS